jgi:thiol-disulfide isomerase/thioredoxin
MDNELILRLIWAIGLVLAGLGLFQLTNRILLRPRNKRLPAMENVHPGVPAILYFTTPDCAPCKTIQRPALQKVRDLFGERLQIIEIDAAANPDTASAWNVLSVPTTFVLDARGQPRHVNHGATGPEKLFRQLEKIVKI